MKIASVSVSLGIGNPMSKRTSQFAVYLSAKPLMDRFQNDPNPEAIARALGCNSNTVRCYLSGQYAIHYVQADKYAIRLGLHPFNIWGEEWIAPSLPRLKGKPEQSE